jgi:hypothetical protein
MAYSVSQHEAKPTAASQPPHHLIIITPPQISLHHDIILPDACP